MVKKMERALILIQWLVFGGFVFFWGLFSVEPTFSMAEIFNGKEGWFVSFLAVYLPLIFLILIWIFQGRLILFPWYRILPSVTDSD
jgi:hypothetical protein